MTGDMLDVRGVAAALGVCENTARDLIRRPGFPAVRIGRVFRVRRDALDRWLRENEGRQVETSFTGRGSRGPRRAPRPTPDAQAALAGLRAAVARDGATGEGAGAR